MRPWVCAVLGLVLAAGGCQPGRAAPPLAAMQSSEIEALQRRLADAGCYAGGVDGQAGPALAAAVKACPDQEPLLRIETGMHTAVIHRVGVDAQCRLLATGSDDKTVRIWSMPDGRLIRTIRLPIGEGNGGKIFAVALSPDGRTLAAGGWDAAWDRDASRRMGVSLVDLATGGVRRLGNFESAVSQLAFSADSARLVVGLGASGVRVLDRDTGRELKADRDYGGSVYGAVWAPDGSFFATSYDGFVRRYGPDLKLAAKAKAPDGARPFGITVSPDGRRVGVGYDDAAGVSILDATTLKALARGDTADLAGSSLGSVAMMAGGDLAAGGLAQKVIDGASSNLLRRFDRTGRRRGPDLATADATVMDLQPCGTGLVFASGDPRFGLVGADGSLQTLVEPVTVDMRGKLGDAFTLSGDSARVRFGLGLGARRPVLFDLAAGTLAEAPTATGGLNRSIVEGLPVGDWESERTPTFKGKPIALDAFEMSRALAVRPDSTGFVLAADYWLRSFDAAGRERWKRALPGTAWGVNLSADGRIAVVADSDGTVRWHRWSDGQELLALFVHVPTKRWVAWTPTGYYMASPGAEDLIGWHLNRGWNQPADFFPASRFRDRFNRPDVVRTVLQTLDEGEALRQADAAAHKRPDAKPIIERLPPVLTILSPAEGARVAPGPVEIRYRTRLPSGGTVDRVEAFVDGARIEARGLAPAEQPAGADGMGVITLPMPAHDVSISLVAYAGGKASDAARVQLKGAAPAAAGAEDDALKPNLYALLVGVSHYDVARYDLAYPAKDAAGLAEALKAQEGRLYRHVEVKVLTDKEASTTGVKRGLSWLRRQTTAHDLAIVFAAGHGTTDAKGKFWFLSSDMDPDDVAATAVSQDDIENVLFDLPGKKLLFLDACHSGAALNAGARGGTDVSAAVSDFAQAEGGVVAYAASTGREFSFERDDWGHGAFTKALIEGFGGGADLLHKGTVTTATLDLFVEQRVKDLTGGQQHPVMTRPKTVPDFPIATVQ